MARFTRQLLTVCLTLAGITLSLSGISLPARGEEPVNITVNQTVKYQTIKGWLCILPKRELKTQQAKNLRDAVIEYGTNDLGLTGFRIEPDRRQWEDVINNRAFTTTGVDQEVNDWVLPFKKAVEANGDPFYLYENAVFYTNTLTGDPPAWLLNSPGEATRWFIAFVKHLRDDFTLPVIVNNISLVNEPGPGTACFTTPAPMANWIRTLGPRLVQQGYATRIQYPEGAAVDLTWNYMAPLLNDPTIWPYVGCLSWHNYGSATHRKDIYAFASAHGIPTAETEQLSQAKLSQLCQDLLEGGTSYWMHYSMVAGDADPTYQSDANNASGEYIHDLSDTAFKRYQHYWNIRHITHYIRPGAVRVEATTTNPALTVLAFVKNGQVTTVISNVNGNAPFAVNVSGLPPGKYGLIQTVHWVNPEELGLQTVDADGVLKNLMVPSSGVVTLYPYAGANLPPTITDWQIYPGYIYQPTSSVNLSGRAIDTELDPLAYTWTVTGQPAGANATLANPHGATTAANGLTAPGLYTFTFTVSDAAHPAGVSKKTYITVYDGNQPPGIFWQVRIPAVVNLPVTTTHFILGGSDVDNDPLSYAVTVKSQPVGAFATVENPAGPFTDPKGNPKRGGAMTLLAVSGLTVAGDYNFTATVSDDHGHAVSQDIHVHVWPVDNGAAITEAQAAARTISLPVTSTELISTFTGDATEYLTPWWSVKSAPVGAMPTFADQGDARAPGTGPLGHANTRVDGLTKPGDYVFSLIVATRTKTVSKDVTITVNPPAQP